ncbi:MAG: hypothetical protein HN712_13630 [Gemmatimonadetes bacterium]|nr:hypothetical protein [Gemmatimonadota bacterium]
MTDPTPHIALPEEVATDEASCTVIDAQAGKLTVFRKPASPNPFVNSSLTSLGVDADGVERFWTSCVNSLLGTTSFLVDENGRYRTYPWTVGEGIRAIYSVAKQDDDTIWVTGGAGEVFVRLTLSSGEYETYAREGGRFITAGMALDPDSGKLFVGAQTALISFDTIGRRTVRIYGEEERPPDSHHYDHWRMSDGSYGFILETPGLSFLRWDPTTEEVNWQRLAEDKTHPTVGCVRHLKYVEDGRVYIPHMGWLDGLTGEFQPHDHPPSEEASWFGVCEDIAYGVQWDLPSAAVRILTWGTTNGETRELLIGSNANSLSCALTSSGKILIVDLYGCFRRYDATTGALEITRQIGLEQEHICNAIVPVDDYRATGTPFISQNFWVHDQDAGSGYCAGRAGGSFGQVDYGINVGGKVYFAIYGGGQLTEYDPTAPTGYPINPRLVAATAQGQHGGGITTNGQVIWVAFKPKYGTLDGAMIRYDTRTGLASYRNGAVQAQHVLNPIYDESTKTLVAGTSWLSDCQTAKPVHDTAFAVVLDMDTMQVRTRAAAPTGIDTVVNLGPLGQGQWLFDCDGELFRFSVSDGTLAPYAGRLPDGTSRTLYAGRPGMFVVQITDELLQWDVAADALEPIATLADGFVIRWWVHGADLTFECGRYAAVWRGVLDQGAGAR